MSPRRLIDVRPPRERALMVAAPRKGSADADAVDEHLAELVRLADTAGAQVVGQVVQFVAAPTADFYVGKGKVEEIKARLAELNATLLLFDGELSPTQGKHLEEALKVRVMDRTELILDIFALRARSHEAKLQVELAQLAYLLPRLTRMWVHLSRIRGGIGLRGPGETQLETDRRAIRQKIQLLESKLADVAAHRQRLRDRSRLRGVSRVALVGYTNAGKSSLLRALTGADAHVEDRLFATLDTASREVQAGGGKGGGGGGRAVRFTDTVGFIRKLPHDLVASFRSTLEEAQDADVLLHVVDAAHPGWAVQASTVNEALAEAGLQDKPMVVALNKADRLNPDEAESRLRDAGALGYPAVLVSATRKTGLAELSRHLAFAPGVEGGR